MALIENSNHEATRETPMYRLTETWKSILMGSGWEYNLMRNTATFSVPIALSLGFFSRYGQNKKQIVEQLLKKNVREEDIQYLVNKDLNRANLRTAVRVGPRYAAIPIVLCGVTLSTFSYRNSIHAPDFAAAYGLCGGLYFASRGLKQAAQAATVSATFGLVAAGMIWLIMYSNDLCVRDFRMNLSANYNFGVEHRNRMKMYKDREDFHMSMLVQRERERLQAEKDAARRN